MTLFTDLGSAPGDVGYAAPDPHSRDDGLAAVVGSWSARRRSAERRRRATVLAAQAGIVALVLVAWELLSGNPQDGALLDEFLVGRPSGIADAFLDWQGDGRFWGDIWVTLQETVIGFVIGCVSGLAVGFMLGVNKTLSRIFSPFVSAAFAIPRLALAPLFILWFGLGMGSKVALVALLVFFLVFFNTFAGAKQVDRSLLDVLAVMGATRFAQHRLVTLPSAAVWVIAGLRVSVPYAFVGAIVGEMLAANRGLGYVIARSAGQFNPELMFAAIAVSVVLSLALTGGVTVLERYWLRWQPRADDLPGGNGSPV